MLNVAYSKYTYNVQSQLTFNRKLKIVLSYFSTQYMKIILQKLKKTDYALVPLLKGTKSRLIGKRPQF